MDYITINEAARQAASAASKMLGICVIAMVLIAAAAWVAVGIAYKQGRRSKARAVKIAVERARKECHAEYVKKGAKSWESLYWYRKTVDELERELEAAKKAIDDIAAENADLREQMGNISAGGFRGKRGAF